MVRHSMRHRSQRPYPAILAAAVVCAALANTVQAASAGAQVDRQASSARRSRAADAHGFGYGNVIARAKALAAKDYQPPHKIPGFLRKLSSHKRAAIRYKRSAEIGYARRRPFRVMFYHPGAFYDHAVAIHVIRHGLVRKVPFRKSDFIYPKASLKKKVPADLGFAGLKILHHLGNPHKFDEVVSFLGASYFRALGSHEHYGLSARGLAIDTADTSIGEEFPNFVSFWLVHPGADRQRLVLYALLNSPSVTGAYRFVITPGKATHTHVEATLFTRKAIHKLGVAPLTGMFTWGADSLTRIDHARPAAHDCDGLLIAGAHGQWIWRPLINPHKLRINRFDASHLKGFGLIQRDRRFAHYQSLRYQYQRRPSAWVTPQGHWGQGKLELVEIPSNSEVNDNIDVYWVPKKPVKAGQRLHFAYDIRWSSGPALPKSLAHTVATRMGRVAPAPDKTRNQRHVMIDFAGGRLPALTAPGAVHAKISTSRKVKLKDVRTVRNPHTQGWRVSFRVPNSALSKPLRVRVYLAGPKGGGLTETWSDVLVKR